MRPIYCYWYFVVFSDPQIAEVIDDLVADENKFSASTGITLFILDPNNSLSEYIMIVTVIVHIYLCLTRSNNKWLYVAF